MKAAGTQQPIALPTLRWRPDFVRGTPIFRESRPLAADKPDARFHENESPGIPFFLRPMKPPGHLTIECTDTLVRLYIPDRAKRFLRNSLLLLKLAAGAFG